MSGPHRSGSGRTPRASAEVILTQPERADASPPAAEDSAGAPTGSREDLIRRAVTGPERVSPVTRPQARLVQRPSAPHVDCAHLFPASPASVALVETHALWVTILLRRDLGYFKRFARRVCEGVLSLPGNGDCQACIDRRNHAFHQISIRVREDGVLFYHRVWGMYVRDPHGPVARGNSR